MKSNYNIFDINYIISHENLNSYLLKNKYSDSLTKLFFGIIKHFKVITINVIFKNFGIKKLQKSEFAFFGASSNNIRSLQPVQKKLEYSQLYSKQLPYGLSGLYSLKYILTVINLYNKSKGYLKSAIASDFSTFCMSFAMLDTITKAIVKINPKICVVANDHGYIYRVVFRVAQSLNIKTAYLQHASVNVNFPPLEYDFAFLDGLESLEKYLHNKSCKSIVFLSGASRFDFINEIIVEVSNEKKIIGIAINKNDDKEKIINFINQINSTGQYECILRPHPSQRIKDWKSEALQYNFKLSESTKENPLTFISKTDIIIAGKTSFHLDVAIMSKQSFHYNFTNAETSDHYGYLRRGLTIDITTLSIEQTITIFENTVFTDKIDLIRYYVANYGTKYWGKSSDIIATTIKGLINQGVIPDFWERKEYNNFCYYQLL